jgi:hypothetical protein
VRMSSGNSQVFSSVCRQEACRPVIWGVDTIYNGEIGGLAPSLALVGSSPRTMWRTCWLLFLSLSSRLSFIFVLAQGSSVWKITEEQVHLIQCGICCTSTGTSEWMISKKQEWPLLFVGCFVGFAV